MDDGVGILLGLYRFDELPRRQLSNLVDDYFPYALDMVMSCGLIGEADWGVSRTL